MAPGLLGLPFQVVVSVSVASGAIVSLAPGSMGSDLHQTETSPSLAEKPSGRVLGAIFTVVSLVLVSVSVSNTGWPARNVELLAVSVAAIAEPGEGWGWPPPAMGPTIRKDVNALALARRSV